MMTIALRDASPSGLLSDAGEEMETSEFAAALGNTEGAVRDRQ
jgi:hypothetical protein